MHFGFQETLGNSMLEIRAARGMPKLEIEQNQYRIAARIAVSDGDFGTMEMLQ